MACSQTFNGIPTDCSPSMGGIRVIYVANHDDVAEKTVTDDIISAIKMAGADASAAKFKKYAFRKGTGSMTSTLTADSVNGVNFVTTDLVLQFGKMDTAKRIEINALAIGYVDVIVEDRNGKFWYLGYDNPVTASAGEGGTGTAETDPNRYTITLHDVSHVMPYEVDAAIIDGLVD